MGFGSELHGNSPVDTIDFYHNVPVVNRLTSRRTKACCTKGSFDMDGLVFCR
jgi:hypothetical protein